MQPLDRRKNNKTKLHATHLDLDDFHLEHEGVAALDLRRAAAVTVAKLRRNVPARDEGVPVQAARHSAPAHISHLSPSTISCIASVQPLMTCSGAVTQQRNHAKAQRARATASDAEEVGAGAGRCLVGGEGGGLAALVAAVELRAVGEGACIVAFARRVHSGVEDAAAVLQHFVLQA